MKLQNHEKERARLVAAFKKQLAASPGLKEREIELSWSNWGFGIESLEDTARRLAANRIQWIELHGNRYGEDLGYRIYEPSEKRAAAQQPPSRSARSSSQFSWTGIGRGFGRVIVCGWLRRIGRNLIGCGVFVERSFLFLHGLAVRTRQDVADALVAQDDLHSGQQQGLVVNQQYRPRRKELR